MACYGGYMMNKSCVSADHTKQFWRCKNRMCHGTAESPYGNDVDLIERKPHDKCVESPMAVQVNFCKFVWYLV